MKSQFSKSWISVFRYSYSYPLGPCAIRLHILRARKCLIPHQCIAFRSLICIVLLIILASIYVCIRKRERKNYRFWSDALGRFMFMFIKWGGWIRIRCSICFLVASETSRASSCRTRDSNRGTSISSHNSIQGKEPGIVKFTMEEIFQVTRNFSPSFKIGQGGFGTVYKAKLLDGTVVAVKRAKKVVSIVFSLFLRLVVSLFRYIENVTDHKHPKVID